MMNFFEGLEAVDCQIETVGEEASEGGVSADCEQAVGVAKEGRGSSAFTSFRRDRGRVEGGQKLWTSNDPFPLTPALSPRERERCIPSLERPELSGSIDVRMAILPLLLCS